jgi:hypothetical protein
MNPSIRERYEQRQAQVEPVPLPRSEGEWFVHEMGSADFVAFNRGYDEQLKAGKHLAHFAAYGACDAAGQRLFANEDVDWIAANVPGWVLGQVWASGAKLNRLTVEAEQELEKN